MCPMNRLRLVVLLVVGVTLFASTPARAKPGQTSSSGSWGTIQLMNTGAEPEAAGEASLTGVKVVAEADFFWPYGVSYRCSGKLTVNCQNLTPGASYWTPAGMFTADDTGAGRISGKVDFGFYVAEWCPPNPYMVEVVRLDPDGSDTTVLTGYFYPVRY